MIPPTRSRPFRFLPLSSTRRLPAAGQRYFRFASRETCFVRDEFWIRWLIDHGVHSFLDVPNGKVYDYYIHESSSLALFHRLDRWLAVNWQSHIRRYRTSARRHLEAAERVAVAAQSQNSAVMLDAYSRLWQTGYDFGEYIWGAWAVIYVTEPRVLAALPEQMELISSLEQPIAYLQMLRDFRRLSPAATAARYGWLNMYNPDDRPYSVRDIVRLKHHMDRRDVERQFKRLRTSRLAYRRFRATLRDARLGRAVDMVHAYAFLKTDRIDVWRQAMARLRPFFQELARRIPGATLHEAVNLSTSEIRALLADGHQPDLRSLRQRARHRALYYAEPAKIQVTTDWRFIRQTQRRILTMERIGATIHGTTACDGNAAGRVVIIRHSSDIRKVRAGDIFVARYTFPSYTPAMRKCAAVVTDEGGLTSHAAIVSREFGIPCIVGTGVATRVFKDGDRVEVDAVKGMVRKV